MVTHLQEDENAKAERAERNRLDLFFFFFGGEGGCFGRDEAL